MNFEMLPLLPKMISDAYKMFDQLNLSVTSLVAIAAVLSLLFLFAAREAAAWFFKVDDVKKDVRKLRQLVIDLEGEIRALQGLLNQNLSLASTKVNEDATHAAASSNQSSNQAPNLTVAPPTKFSINH